MLPAPAYRVARHRAVDAMAYAAAIALAGAAAWFSIRGMVVLFPGAPSSVVAMAVTMETAKLVTAGWLARRWRATALVLRLILMVLVAGPDVVRIAPSLVISLDEILEGLARLETALGKALV